MADIPGMNDKKSRRKKILLAEDDDSMRRFLEITLERADYEVTSAEDGLAAMQIALENEFDAVVADDVMPNMTGHDLCRVLRQNPQKKQIPFIILSGFGKDGAETSEEGMPDAHLLKGGNLKNDLTDTLGKILSADEDKQ